MTQDTYHLLIVDDEDTTRRSLADILRLEGYHVETASGGKAAIEIITAQAFDLVLLDLKMPGIDGLEVLRHISSLELSSGLQSPLQPNPTVIMLTAHGSLESAIEALRHGAHDYLLKPSSPEQIISSVAKALGARSAEIQQATRLIQLEKANLRAEEHATGKAQPLTPNIYRLPDQITYDPARREFKYKQVTISMTPTEGKLIQVFLDNPGQVFNHRELVLKVQGYQTKDWEAPEVLRPLVSRLRRKLNRLPGGNTWIISVRGTGYLFEVPGKPAEP